MLQLRVNEVSTFRVNEVSTFRGCGVFEDLVGGLGSGEGVAAVVIVQYQVYKDKSSLSCLIASR
jgi:hypothetical protein